MGKKEKASGMKSVLEAFFLMGYNKEVSSFTISIHKEPRSGSGFR